MNLYYTINIKDKKPYSIARFNLIWRFNYVLSGLFVALISAYIFEGDLKSAVLFLFAFLLTTGSLFFLYKTQNTYPIYFIISLVGVLISSLAVYITPDEVHYGNLLWTIVAVAIAYFGLGAKTGKYFAFVGLVGIISHIWISLNENVIMIKQLETPDLIALTIEIVIAFLIIFYIIYQYTTLYSASEKQLIKTNFDLEEQNEYINQQNYEKGILLKEIHHRVKNNLQLVSSLLNLQSNSQSNTDVAMAIKEGQSRIKTMSLIHQRLYKSSKDQARLNLKEYVTELVNSIYQSYGNKEVVNVVEVCDISIDIDTAIPLGLIINELLTNSYKYAFNNAAGVLSVYLVPLSSKDFKLHVSDTGPGIPDKLSLETSTTLGLKLVKILTKQLKGNVQYYYDNGANFVINFREKDNNAETENEDTDS